MEKLKSILLISQFHQAFFHFWVFVLTIPFAGDIYYFLQFFGLKYLNLLRYSLNVMFLQGLSPVILPKMSSHSYSHIEVIVVVVQSPSVSNPETPWMQHHRPPCLSLSRRVCPSLCPLNRWCYPTISSFVVPFSSWLQSFPSSGSFPMSQLFASVSQSIVASASVLPVNIQDWFPLGLTGLISLQSTGLSRVFSSTTVRKH